MEFRRRLFINIKDFLIISVWINFQNGAAQLSPTLDQARLPDTIRLITSQLAVIQLEGVIEDE